MATISIEEQYRIEKIIDDIKLRTGLSYPENNLLDIAKALAVPVFEIDFSKLGEGFSKVNGITQWVDANDQKSPVIYINENYSPERKTFTLAHELGHFILHEGRDKLRIDFFDYSENTEESKEETEANFFAATLLVPRIKLEWIFGITGGDTSKIANYFGVSPAVIETRIKWIKSNNLQAK